MWYLAVLAFLCSYLLGNLNGAVIVSSIYAHDDVRTHGSGNAGLTNFIRTYGPKIAIYVILIDVGKALLACFASGMLLNGYGYYKEGVAVGALFVILGHAFPALLGFRGGKGILSGVTVACMMDWRMGLLVFGISWWHIFSPAMSPWAASCPPVPLASCIGGQTPTQAFSTSAWRCSSASWWSGCTGRILFA